MNSDLKRVGLVFDSEGNANFVKTLQQVNASLRENYNQFKISQAEWNNSTSSTEKLAKQQEYLTERYDIQSDKVKILKMQLDELNSSEEKNEKAIAKKEKELVQAEVQLKKYGTQLNDVNSKLSSSVEKHKELVESLTNVGDKIENVGKKASVLSGVVAAGLTASVKSAIDFESAFTGVEKTVDGTKEQLEDLKQGIRDLAKEIPASTTEISAVAEAAGQLGIQTDNILNFTETMINMGNATNLSAEEAATTLARFANVTKMSQTDFDKLGSTIVALGNNFATTEAEIAEMGMNLGSAGSQIGMTQSEIMALATALSSVGLEAQAGGTAFSKLMINMQLAVETGSDDLKDFAKVAGMTADEFSKAFKEDATDALLKFIDGLSKSGEQGESAIKILDDMGITETRLRDSILRATNASDIFTDAIKLGNDAWDENTALTNEADKRYGTLKSKLEIVKNKLLDNVITIGNKLMPVVEKVIDKIGKWTDNLSKLNDGQIETILKIGALVVAAGPVITVIGKITSGVGDAIGKFSKFSDALKVASGDMETTDTSVKNLAGVISNLTSPVGLAIEAVGLLVGAVAIYKSQLDDGSEATQRLSDEIQKNIDAYNDLKEAQEKEAESKLIEIEHTKDLYYELQNITDENGHIKQGYEDRANFIVNELQNSLGTEIKIVDGIISNYQSLQDEISKTIMLKRANILLDLAEEKYKNSYTEIKDGELYNDIINHKEELLALEQKLIDKQQEYDKWVDQGGTILALRTNDEINNLEKNIAKVKEEIAEEEKVYNQHLQNITNYEEGSAIVLSGDYDNIQNWANKTQLALNEAEENETKYLSNKLNQMIYNTNYYKKLLDENVENQNSAERQALENQYNNNKEMQDAIIQSMIEQTSTINENSPQIIDAWKTLATKNKEKYSEVMNTLPPALQDTINEMTGLSESSIDKMGSVLWKKSEEAKQKIKNPFKDNSDIEDLMDAFLSPMDSSMDKKIEVLWKKALEAKQKAEDPFNDNSGMKKVMNNFLSPMSTEMDNYSPVLEQKAGNIASNILSKFKSVFDIHSPSRETKKIFKNLMLGSEQGIESEEENLYAQVDDVAENVLDGLNSVNDGMLSSNYYNNSSNNIGLSIDYNQLYLCFLKALNNCKLKLDDDGFVRIIDDRMREVM